MGSPGFGITFERVWLHYSSRVLNSPNSKNLAPPPSLTLFGDFVNPNFDIFKDLEQIARKWPLAQEFDRFISEVSRSASTKEADLRHPDFTQTLLRFDGNPPVDAIRYADHLEISIDLPGVEPSEIEVTVENSTLSIEVAKRCRELVEGAEVIFSGRPAHRIFRSFTFGPEYDIDSLSANCELGVLTIAIPVAKRAQAKRVVVNSSAEQSSTEEE